VIKAVNVSCNFINLSALRNSILTYIISGNSYDPNNKVDFHFGDEERKLVSGDNMDCNSKYSDTSSRKTDVSMFVCSTKVCGIVHGVALKFLEWFFL
jgi:hypothetical protein